MVFFYLQWYDLVEPLNDARTKLGEGAFLCAGWAGETQAFSTL